ncbi:MAG: cation:proton antiporter, partial [Bacteroidaceae bacterium]|nr:cation:proton antiporter [Bacteroidaceae bacterium]
SEILVGLHRRRTPSDSLLGQFAQGLIDGLNRQIIIVRYTIPVNTIRKIIVAVPARAQYETGFYRWVERISRLSIEIGCRINFHASEETARLIRGYLNHYHPLVRDEYSPFDSDSSLELLAQETGSENLFVLITARKGTISYEKRMTKMQFMLTKYFSDKNLIIVYPDQEGEVDEVANFYEPHGSIQHGSWMNQWLSKWISKIG